MTNNSQSNLKELTANQELIAEKNLVWIFGFNNLEFNETCDNLLSERVYFLKEPKIGLQLNNIIPWKGKNKPNTYLELHQKAKRANKPNYDYFFYNGFKETWYYYLRKLIINRIYQQFEDFSKNVVIQETSGSAACQIISNLFPNSRIIIVSTDGRQLVNEQIQKMNESFINNQNSQSLTSKKSINKIKNEFTRWNSLANLMIKAYEEHEEKLRLMISFENLKKNDYKTLENFFGMIGIPISENELQNISDKKNGEDSVQENRTLWETNFSDEEKSNIKNTIEKNLTAFGYS